MVRTRDRRWHGAATDGLAEPADANYCQIDMRSLLELRQLDAISASPHAERDPVVVVGSGLAGLLVALRAAPAVPVVLITKTALGDGNTVYAQGGMAAAVGPGDSIDAHVADTLAAGAGLCDADVVAEAVAAGPSSIAILEALGVPFDRDGRRLALGREGAHSADRIVHAGGDSTGARMIEALRAAVRADPRIEVREHTRVREILLSAGRVRGVRHRGHRRGARLDRGPCGGARHRRRRPAVLTDDEPGDRDRRRRRARRPCRGGGRGS